MPSQEPKTVPTAASVTDFIAAVADAAKRADCKELIKLMRAATGEKPRMWGSSIVGFGRCRTQYADGRSAEWPLIGFSPRKGDLTLYIMPGFVQQQGLLAQLGAHKTGKSCLYIKRLADVDTAVLAQIIGGAVQGMAGTRVLPRAEA